MDISNGNNGTPTPGQAGEPKDNEGINVSNLESMLNKAVNTAVATVLSSKANDKTENSNDGVTDFLKKQEEEKKSLEQQNRLVSYYADVYASFHQHIKNPEEMLAKLSVGSLDTNDKCNKLAKIVIAEAYGSGDQTNAMLSSFEKQNVVDESTAFSLQYKNALEKLNSSKKSFLMKTPINTEITDDELANLSKDLFSYKTRDLALLKAKNLKLIA